MIQNRRDQLNSHVYEDRGDFLTKLLKDDFFKGSDEMMIDECVAFMGAATQTTTLMISNALYYLT